MDVIGETRYTHEENEKFIWNVNLKLIEETRT
jgi:hypothetical protein